MRAFRVVVNRPAIQICLECFHAFVEVSLERNTKEFVQYRLVEVLNESVDLWGFHLRSAVFDIIGVR